MAKQFLTINKPFLDSSNYEALSRNSGLLNAKYSDLCQLFQRQFQAFIDKHMQLAKALSPERAIQSEQKKKKFKFIVQLSSFIREFQDLIKVMSEYQIDCMEHLKENNKSELQITSQIIKKANQNKSLGEEIEKKRNVLVETYTEIKKHYVLFEQSSKNPVICYQPEKMQGIQNRLKQKISKDLKVMDQILAHRQECEEKIDQFEPYLNTYRKRLIKNKYTVLKKIVYLIKNTKTATIQLFDALKNCAINKRKDYLSIIERKDDDINYLKDYLKQASDHNLMQHYTEQNKKWQRFTSRSIAQFQQAFEQIQFIVTQLIASFNHFCDTCSALHQSFRNLTNQINDYYEESESPYTMMKELLDVQLHFTKKIRKIVVKLQEIQNKLRSEKSNCKKQAEILLTFIKVNKSKYKSFMQNFENNNQLVELINSISFEPTKRSILVLYDEFINFQNQLLSQFDYYRMSRRQPVDSMEISHSTVELLVVNKKIPLKQEYWLWRDWKSQIEINFQYVNDYFEEIQGKIQNVVSATTVEDSTLLEQFEATLVQSHNQQEGQIQLKVNSFDFSSDSINLSIPWKQITGVHQKNKVWKDILIISTPRGQIKFLKIDDIQAVMNSIKDTQEKGSLTTKKKVQKKPEVQLSEEDLVFISERKQKIKNQLPDMSTDFRLVTEETFSNVRLDEMYDIFYSDKTFNFYGKDQPCFHSYVVKKAGNYDLTSTKYDQNGPEYYSGDPEVSFKNCPVFSSRQFTFTHPLKPSGIPFMPKISKNKDIRKMYWVSNQELIYQTESVTEGVPYCDTFRVIMVHKLKKVQTGVKLQIFLKIKWLQNTMMKGTITDSINPEVDKGMNDLVAEINKVLKLMDSLQKGQEVQIPKDEQTAEQVKTATPDDELSKVKLLNKILMGAFIGFIIFKIVSMIFF